MASKVALCVDELSSRNPEHIGLEGEVLDAQDWLEVFSRGEDARRAMTGSSGYLQAWVLSCDDIEPINLAAAIKQDCPEMRVSLIAREPCGSLMSRAHTAQIDEVLDCSAFPRRYAEAKMKFRGAPEITSAETTVARNDASGDVPMTLAETEVVISRAAHASHAQAQPQGQAQAELQITPQLQVQPQLALTTTPQSKAGPIVVKAASRAFVMPIVSGSGGAGKSAVSALGALISQRMGHRTLLLDYDLQFGDVASMLGVEDPLRIDEALSRPDKLEAELARDDRIAVIAPPLRLEASEEVVLRLPALLENLVTSFDVIIANTGAAWAEQHAALLERSSAALFLVDQRASSVWACRHALELCARCGIATGPFQFALNRCAKGAPLTSVDVSCALQGALVHELRDGGRDVEDYLSSGSASELLDVRNEFAKSLEQVMQRMLPAGNVHTPANTSSEPERRTSRRRGRHAERKRGWRLS